MNALKNWVKRIAAVAVICAILPREASAYLDPGTGSYLLQLMLAFLLGGLFSFKLFWRRIKEWIRSVFSRKK